MAKVVITLDDFNVYIHQFGTAVPTTIDKFDITVWGAKSITPDLDYSGYFGSDINGIPYPKAYIGTNTDNKDSIIDFYRPKQLIIEMFRTGINYQELNRLFEYQQLGTELIFIDGASKIFSYGSPFESLTGVCVGGVHDPVGSDIDNIGVAAYYGAYAGYITSINGEVVHQSKAIEGDIILNVMISRVGIQIQTKVGHQDIGHTQLIGWFLKP